MGRTHRPQVALYLDPDRRDYLIMLAEMLGTSQQLLLREALDVLLAKHGVPDAYDIVRSAASSTGYRLRKKRKS